MILKKLKSKLAYWVLGRPPRYTTTQVTLLGRKIKFVNEPQRLDELISLLARHHFRIYIDSPGLSSVNPFMNVQTSMDMDMQLNIHAIKA